MAFHTYCITGTDGAGPTTPATIELCHFNDDFQLETREKDLQRLNTAGFVTEFGAVSDKPTGIDEVRFVCDHMDKMNPPISWTFWDHNLIFGDANYEKELSRAYPQAVAGTIESFHFDAKTSEFTMSYVSSHIAMQTTEIFLGNAFYPNGTNVLVSPESCCDVSHTGNGGLFITHHDTGVSVSVKVSAL